MTDRADYEGAVSQFEMAAFIVTVAYGFVVMVASAEPTLTGLSVAMGKMLVLTIIMVFVTLGASHIRKEVTSA